MPFNPHDTDIIFEPQLNLISVFNRRLRKIFFYGLNIFLILFGLGGLLNFIYQLLVAGFQPPESSQRFFWISLLAVLFLFYLWQRQKEKVKKIRLPQKGEIVEISDYLDEGLANSLDRAWLYCYRKSYHFLRPIHLFYAFLFQNDFKKIIKRLNCGLAEVKKKTENVLVLPGFSRDRTSGFDPKISPELKNSFLDAYLSAFKSGRSQVSFLDLLLAISHQSNLVQMVFDEFGISPQEIEQVLDWMQVEKEIKQWEERFYWARLFKPKGKMNRAMTAAATPLLDRLSRDLTYLARSGAFEMVVGREKEISEIFSGFASGQMAMVLVGSPGIGKKAIIHKLACLMVEENVPKFLQDRRLVELEISGLVGAVGAKEKGEEYLERLIFEVNRAKNIVLFIDDIDNLVGLKSHPAGLDFSEILAAALEKRALFVLGATTDEGFASKIEGRALGRVIGKIKIEPPTGRLLWQILVGQIYAIEKRFKIVFSADAIDQAIELADRYLYGSALPTRAERLLEEAATLVFSRRGQGALVKGDDLVELVSQKTNIPLGQVRQKEKELLLNLEGLIHQRIINQEEAVKVVASALRRSRAELEERQKPIANFLFIGPTGVGKTELSKALAAIYFGSEKRMIRLDMSEYQEKRGLARLIGLRAESGLEKGYLTEAVKRQPYALLLLDELEKAHPDILNLFLQVMDDGRLTDASGETINFTNIILIATSNAGTQFIQERIRQNIAYEEIYRRLKDKVLLDYFRPEFLNRFDKIVLFRPLSMDNVVEISRLMLDKIRLGLEQKGVDFEVSEESIRELAQLGFDPLYGARPLKRVIQEKIEDGLARLFLENKVKRRDKIIINPGLVFEVEPAPRI